MERALFWVIVVAVVACVLANKAAYQKGRRDGFKEGFACKRRIDRLSARMAIDCLEED